MPRVRRAGHDRRMGRMPRLDLPGIPQHVVQRGNNRLPCFVDDHDRRRYLRHLREAADRLRCDVHAYVLMTNHVHLLVTPPRTMAVSRMMQVLGRNYAGYFNVRHARSGTLWEGRFKSCIVDTELYLLRCYRYIELNPVRAGLVADPADFAWSSYRANALGRGSAVVTPHAEYLRLGSTVAARLRAYRALVAEAMSADALAQLRVYLQQQRALGSPLFRAAVAARVRRFCDIRPAHRPSGSSAPRPPDNSL
jgi:putative transposase